MSIWFFVSIASRLNSNIRFVSKLDAHYDHTVRIGQSHYGFLVPTGHTARVRNESRIFDRGGGTTYEAARVRQRTFVKRTDQKLSRHARPNSKGKLKKKPPRTRTRGYCDVDSTIILRPTTGRNRDGGRKPPPPISLRPSYVCHSAISRAESLSVVYNVSSLQRTIDRCDLLIAADTRKHIPLVSVLLPVIIVLFIVAGSADVHVSAHRFRQSFAFVPSIPPRRICNRNAFEVPLEIIYMFPQ